MLRLSAENDAYSGGGVYGGDGTGTAGEQRCAYANPTKGRCRTVRLPGHSHCARHLEVPRSDQHTYYAVGAPAAGASTATYAVAPDPESANAPTPEFVGPPPGTRAVGGTGGGIRRGDRKGSIYAGFDEEPDTFA